MSRCKGCGKEYRKGVVALLIVPGSSLKGARVCQDCAAGGSLIVAAKVAPVVQRKVARSDGVARVLRMLNTYAKASRAGAKADGAELGVSAAGVIQQGRAEGFEGAIECIKRECGGES